MDRKLLGSLDKDFKWNLNYSQYSALFYTQIKKWTPVFLVFFQKYGERSSK